MRTTVHLPPELFRRAKASAASQGETLKTFFTRALQNEVGGPHTAEETRVKLPLIHSKSRQKIRLTNRDIERIFAEEDRLKYEQQQRLPRRRRASS